MDPKQIAAIQIMMQSKHQIDTVIALYNDHEVHWKHMYLHLFSEIGKAHSEKATDEVLYLCKYLVECINAANSPKGSVHYIAVRDAYGEDYMLFLSKYKIAKSQTVKF